MNISFKPLADDISTEGFSCESPELTDFFINRAHSQHRNKVCKVFVLYIEGQIAGFFTLNNANLVRDDLDESSTTKRKLVYTDVPAILIGRLARDTKFKGKGVGEILLMEAFEKAVQADSYSSAWGLGVDAKDLNAEKFYFKFGFKFIRNQTSYPKRMYLPMVVVIKTISGMS